MSLRNRATSQWTWRICASWCSTKVSGPNLLILHPATICLLLICRILHLFRFRTLVVGCTDYDAQHRVVKLFWRMLEQDFSELERRALLLFWTGSSVPPRGGFSVDAEYDQVCNSRER